MTRSEAITALYALFNAPHNADINLVGLNVLLDELYKSHPQEEPWPEEPEGHIAGGVHPPQRTWVGLTTTQVKLLWEGVQEEAVKSGDSLNWVFYTHINKAIKEKNT